MAMDDGMNVDTTSNDSCFNPFTPPVPRASFESLDDLEKVKRIEAACKGPGDLQTLISLATSANGFIDDKLRRLACKLILSVNHPLRLRCDQGQCS